MSLSFNDLIDGIDGSLDDDNYVIDADFSDDKDSVDLEVVDINVDLSDKTRYPNLLLKGITTINELDFISSITKGKKRTLLPLYVEYSGITKYICDFNLTFDNLLLLSRMKGYSLHLNYSETESSLINLADAGCLAEYLCF